jgi:predicted nucleotidyltransferase component of viral defense system
MIHTAQQIKALVRNMSVSDSGKAQVIIRAYAIERFLERLSQSRFKDSFILKGGILVALIVGLEHRATLDIDATVKNLILTPQAARDIVGEICRTPVEDGMIFEIKDTTTIMDEADYAGVRLSVEARLESMRTPMKIDISTGDIITPHEVLHSFGLMFEDRSISLWAYSLETVLAEKLETIISRGTANTRMRDFYDIYILQKLPNGSFDPAVLARAVENTSRKRGSEEAVLSAMDRFNDIASSTTMRVLWTAYQRKFEFAKGYSWDEVVASVKDLFAQTAIVG